LERNIKMRQFRASITNLTKAERKDRSQEGGKGRSETILQGLYQAGVALGEEERWITRNAD
jgi:hypothetical protein